MDKALVLSLCFLCFTLNCFAYDIEHYPGKPDLSSQGILNLVFCSLNYKDAADFAKDREILIQRLKKTKPFDEYNNLKFWYINLSRKEESKVFKPASVFPFLTVRKDFLADILAKLKGVYKLIIIDASAGVFAAELSSPDRVSLIILSSARYRGKDSFARSFLHELGHSLGLRDEGLNSEAALCLPGPPNCAPTKKEAEEWWGDLAGKEPRVNYISGCSGNKNYIRPTIASLMNNPEKANDFGPVNERYLRKELGRL
ncbi:MAG: hypothetical protein KKC39_00875 [Candidatus Omnitrophica bacterium]|nr:hypothetical protein [Candidatus Omnitrophota bacterium]MBU4303622.1 hypothetical protein [Candidatus Omnitrophota bacterium]MBU4467284.1 hypothetical protein [Candidatus Omnitrophota bacterium]MCG2708174.1 hypothetical protein [Candidatus Omnitrophota bacterium]